MTGHVNSVWDIRGTLQNGIWLIEHVWAVKVFSNIMVISNNLTCKVFYNQQQSYSIEIAVFISINLAKNKERQNYQKGFDCFVLFPWPFKKFSKGSVWIYALLSLILTSE